MHDIYKKMDQAILDQNIENIKIILKDKNFNISHNLSSCFRLAVQEEYLEAVELFLLEKDINVNIKNGEPLLKCIINDNLTIFNLLLSQKNIKPHINYNSLLKDALNFERYDMAEKLFKVKSVKNSLTGYFACKLRSDSIKDFYFKLKIKENANNF